jgi:hypothetical protein
VRQTKSDWVFIPLMGLVVLLVVVFVPLAMRISREAAPDLPVAQGPSAPGVVSATEPPAEAAETQAPAETGAPPRRRAVAEVAAEWGMAGAGNTTTDPFDMPAGPTEFGFTFTEPTPFRVRLVRADGSEVVLLAEGTGPATVVQKLVTLEAEGSYSLDIQAEGEWAFSVLHDSTSEVVTP